ncbi:MAG: DUF3783 domain-containing protein [Eubacteriales bacterium]|nr:DUF3783 domain-containing protein [Eubacteriales bacterium]
MMRNAVRETVLYYTPQQSEKVVKLKGVLVRMGIRIKNIGPDQVTETVGSLLGIRDCGAEQEKAAELPVLEEEMLVMHKFSGRRLDELLHNLRKAGVPKIELKAVVTETNIDWTFSRLYEEIRKEHDEMSGKENADV